MTIRGHMVHDHAGHYNRPDVFRLLVNDEEPPLVEWAGRSSSFPFGLAASRPRDDEPAHAERDDDARLPGAGPSQLFPASHDVGGKGCAARFRTSSEWRITHLAARC